MNQQQLQKLATKGYISLQRDKKRIASITISRNGGLRTYKADPAGSGIVTKKKHKGTGPARGEDK